jgi:hypothetical protein
MSEPSNFELFKEFFETFERVGFDIRMPIERSNLLGKKRELISLAKAFNPKLSSLSESTFEEYLKKLGCKFPSAAISKNDNRISKLFSAPVLRAKADRTS